LACGAKPSPFPVPGGERALQLRSLADATTLRDAAAQADSAVVIGAGFIGCEAAASLAMRGVATTLVAPDGVPQAKRLGEDAGSKNPGVAD
jgi:3-phenylpropionate/trans-cinnamate dioxygenase ferredoxin reductase subunit